MKKLIFLLILSVNLISCGSKDMDSPPDGSNSGPNYKNESDPGRTDTSSFNRSYHY